MLLFNWLTLQKLIVIVKLTVNVVKKSLLNFIDINQSILFVLFSLCLTLQISLVRRINSKCLADTIQTKVWGFAITILLKDSCFLFSDHTSAAKIQAAFRNYQARLRLKKKAAWQIREKLEYSSEQTEGRVSNRKQSVTVYAYFSVSWNLA